MGVPASAFSRAFSGALPANPDSGAQLHPCLSSANLGPAKP